MMWRGKKARRLDTLLSGDGSPTPTDQDLFPLLRTVGRLREFEERAEPSVLFTTTLEERLMREAAELRKAGPDTPEQFVKRTASRVGPPPPREWDVARRRRLFWRLAAVALVLFSLAGSLWLASQSPPDSPLYGLRRLERTVQLQLAFDPVTRAQVRLAIAQDSLTVLEYAIAQRNPSAYRASLSDFQHDYQAASDAVSAVSSPNQRAGLEASLTALRMRATADLQRALVGMDWADRLTTTSILHDTLGEATPTITRVTYTHTADGLALHVSGAGFMTGATLYLDGRPAGKVLTVTASDIQATLPGITALYAGATVGVSNPDGTAAQFTLAS